MSKSTVNVVNIAALGDLGTEVDVKQVATDSNLPVSNYDPEYNATFLRFDEDGELAILYTSGKYILRGGDELKNVYSVNEEFLAYLKELGVEFQNSSLDIKNVVAVGDLKQGVNLEDLSISLGLEETEYEPEQFPGMVYRPSNTRCVLLVFASGKTVITGGRTIEEDQEAFTNLKEKVDQHL